MNTEQTRSVSGFALLLCLVGAGPCFAQQERGKALPRVWVLATGGTIAGTGASSTDLSNYRSGTVLGEDLVRAVPEIRKHADVKVEQIVNIASLGRLDREPSTRRGLARLSFQDWQPPDRFGYTDRKTRPTACS